MKRVAERLRPMLPALLIAGLVVSCAKEQKKSSDSDSLPAPKVEEEPLEEFSSPDLGLWNLTGPVSGASFASYEVKDSTSMPNPADVCTLDSITFNRQGLVTSMVNGAVEKGKLTLASDLEFTYDADGNFVSGKEKVAHAHGNSIIVKLSRSSGGYLQMLQLLGPDRELSNSDTYVRLLEWTNGLLFYDTLEQGGEGTVRVKYKYNEDGMPQKVTSTISDMLGETKIEATYVYVKFDRYHNWTERRVLEMTEDTEGEADGTNMKTSRHRGYRYDRRHIWYYPPEGHEQEPVRELPVKQ